MALLAPRGAPPLTTHLTRVVGCAPENPPKKRRLSNVEDPGGHGQCPKIQTVASARSTKRQSAVIRRICSIVRARDSSSSGLAPTTPRHTPRDTAPLRRLREKRKRSERGTP